MPAAPTDLTLTSPIEDVPGVTDRQGAAFRRLGVPSVAHLVFFIPFRYEREESEAPIEDVTPGVVATARGEVTETDSNAFGRRPRFRAQIVDHTGTLECVWFNATYLQGRVRPGMRIRVQGKAKTVRGGLQMANPKWEALSEDDADPAPRQSRLRPVYHATESLPSWRIEKAVAAALPAALPLIEDHLTPEYRFERAMPELREAYRMAHAPSSEEDHKAARRRLAYDELLLLQLGVHMRRHRWRHSTHAPALNWSEEIDERIRARIPFTLTPGQEAVVREIVGDLTTAIPANRLIQGDVGSGKTVVALYAMLLASASEKQAALVAPTELLAEQHAASISAMLEGSRVRIELITGSLSPEESAAARRRVESGDADIVVGTHAVLTESTVFSDLAVAIVDEQHRFGVRQRAALRSKSGDDAAAPHTIVMTATPIPRTLSLTLFGDLDVSAIQGLPPGRKPVKTSIEPAERLPEIDLALRARVDAGEQAYVVVPAVDSDELANVQGVVKRLEHGAMMGKRVAAVHGRLKRATRERIMGLFRAGRIDCLVATTVIEVGVDVPNATVMVVEQADRFGLAQLHQLRGRVGRGSAESVCVLVADPATPEGAERLRAMAETSDGFKLAEKDFALRGPGEIFGARQSGLPPFRVADLILDAELLNMARRDANGWIERSPDLAEPTELLLKKRLLKNYGEALGLGDVA